MIFCLQILTWLWFCPLTNTDSSNCRCLQTNYTQQPQPMNFAFTAMLVITERSIQDDESTMESWGFSPCDSEPRWAAAFFSKWLGLWLPSVLCSLAAEAHRLWMFMCLMYRTFIRTVCDIRSGQVRLSVSLCLPTRKYCFHISEHDSVLKVMDKVQIGPSPPKPLLGDYPPKKMIASVVFEICLLLSDKA